MLPEGTGLSEALVSDDSDVLTEGADISKPLVSDDGRDLSDGDSDSRSVKVAASVVDDRLHFKDDSFNGDVLAMLKFCDFVVSDDNNSFRLGDMGEDVDPSFLFLS